MICLSSNVSFKSGIFNVRSGRGVNLYKNGKNENLVIGKFSGVKEGILIQKAAKMFAHKACT